ncbi:hypothetical protein AB0K00_09330 [Dactylosporangium sp. NPDC049525]|uniref:hypothetical protein n=1 Tax=Dactylosporangium sp. NPDC049525 TaxID=3154730 RepID=UPI00341391B8
MRLEQFEALLLERMVGHVGLVTTFAAANYPKPYGLVVQTLDGGVAYVQVVRGNPPGTDREDPSDLQANIARLENAPRAKPGTATVSQLDELGQLLLQVLAGGHGEIAGVQSYADADMSQQPGVVVTFVDGSNLYVTPEV